MKTDVQNTLIYLKCIGLIVYTECNDNILYRQQIILALQFQLKC